MTDIDDATLDALEQRLRADAVGKDNAITSGELAAEFFPDDGEANPQTREAVKTLMRERGLPIIGGGAGYYIPNTPAPIEDAIESLNGRIAGIQERQELLAENWQQWRAPATDGGTTLSPEARQAIETDSTLEVSDVLAYREGES